jgi:hypothetical protein
VRRAGLSIVIVAAAATAAIAIFGYIKPAAAFRWAREPFVWAYIGALWLGGVKVYLGTLRPVAELDEVLASGYGIFSGRKVQWATLRFTPERARYVALEEWHPKQRARWEKDGGYVLEVPFSSEGDLVMDLLSRKVTRGGRAIELKPREFKLLQELLRSKDRVVTRTMLLERVWDYLFDPHTSLIDTHVSRLRKKIDEGFAVPLLHTLRGVGYRLSTHP